MPKEDDAVASAEQVEHGPQRPVLAPDDKLTALNTAVRSALMALPGEFEFPHPVSGVNATDLFSLNTFLGAGIELEVIRTLNGLRHIWDKENQWSEYRFERSNQAFPDVRLVRHHLDGAEDIALGIELKGWWMLAKEGVPSGRYVPSPEACAPHDLICVVPWYLSSAISGLPQVVEPWIESARYAAEWRDYWWQNVRDSKGTDTSISYPEGARPYPEKANRVNAVAAEDSGGNFGRLPRSRPLMDSFIKQTMAVPVLGIRTDAWVSFLQLHRGSATPESIMEKLQRRIKKQDRKLADGTAAEILATLKEVADLLP
ncbi:hypothetical protein GCG21_13745 [Pseudactinotalea sp. HY160]|uniref:hypothetical protein n=1 Tax=Pseudactinotalea sp. HY160 TaxID=2654490 RepID=UPI00128B58F3|nr:hypothetical protein [Pseudactinotalea sp. HY160]MPV51050.1 hypothetical protein [Pseudactinotalea sp. HY160]